MRQQTEAAFQRQVIDLARLFGWRVAHFRPARVLRNGREVYETPVAADGKGWPDLCLVKPGRLLFAELKVGRNTPTAEQDEWLTALRATPAEVYVWTPEHWSTLAAILGGRA